MKKLLKEIATATGIVVGSMLMLGLLVSVAAAQGSLSEQVLRLLTRNNTWSGVNIFAATSNGTLKLQRTNSSLGTPTDFLENRGGNLYWNGSLVGTGGGGSGTVTSIALTLPAIFSVSGSPITTSGTLAATLATESANRIWAGPSSGGAATPTFRALVAADIPADPTISCTACVSWVSVSKSGSSLADLATRSAADLSSGTLPDGRFPATLPALSGVNLTALNATNLGSGTIPAGRMPALTGDITSSAGSVATTLANTAVTPASYTNAAITVDSKGRITAAASATNAIAHNLLSTTHTDTVAASVARGDVIVGNNLPKWARLAVGTVGQFLTTDGTDTLWGTDGSALTALNADNISSGTLGQAVGGTNIDTSGVTDGQILIGTTAGNIWSLSTITGTSNEVIVALGAATITLSTPQAIATGSTPQFARMGIGQAADANIKLILAGQYVNTEYAAGSSSTAITFNWNNGNTERVTMSGNATFTFSNPNVGGFYNLVLVQDGTGSRTVTWPASVRWFGGSAPTLTTTATHIDDCRFQYTGTIYMGKCDLDITP